MSKKSHRQSEAVLLDDIEIFLRASGMSATRFGLLTVNDRAFVHRLRMGRAYRSDTEQKVRAFMRSYEPEAA
jgi:hypothetical protein